jgi:hypothetical protein
MKQSAVSWLIQNIVEDQTIKAKPMSEWLEIFEQAKSMEKEQIIDAISEANKSNNRNVSLHSEQYYNQTYGGDK